ncbi:MAG: glycoside hydrolase family 88 protein [Atribacterota bacterium]
MEEKALLMALAKVELNCSRWTDGFPHVSVHGRYPVLSNQEWTAGFWTGILWLSFLVSGERRFVEVVQGLLPSFAERLFQGIHTDTHDLGFLYLLSCVPDGELLGRGIYREVALQAAEVLSQRFHRQGKYIQAFGKVPPEKEALTIIDSLMNLPLLYWAAGSAEKGKYVHIAAEHAKTLAAVLVREDGSTYQACRFRYPEGELLWRGTMQGYKDWSCWSRGQAWAIYGFTLSYRYTGEAVFLEKALRASQYFLEHLPPDRVACWDLLFRDDPEPRDSSAAAIAASGLLELALVLEKERQEDASLFRKEAELILRALIERYASFEDDCDGLLRHATYHLPKGWGIDECCIWGDYFYLESLLKVTGKYPSLWYYLR